VLTLTEVDGVQTMTSLEIVAYINHVRETEGKPALLHKSFLAKVPTVLGEGTSAKFFAHVQIEVGYGAKRRTPIYRFPERETMLMVMSYSYDMQATVYDAWQAEKNKNAAPVIALPNFDDPVAAAEAWISERKQANALKLELNTATDALVAAQPAIDFANTVKAGDAVYNFLEAATGKW
jgi:hypothetical protein